MRTYVHICILLRVFVVARCTSVCVYVCVCVCVCVYVCGVHVCMFVLYDDEHGPFFIREHFPLLLSSSLVWKMMLDASQSWQG